LRGKRRLHKRGNAAEQEACRMWLAAELARLQPRIVVALGAMAAQTLFGSTFSLTRERGQWQRLAAGTESRPGVPRPSCALPMRNALPCIAGSCGT
jgi:uracil-DNA glycosylase